MQRLIQQPDTSLELQAERQNSREGTYGLFMAYQSNKCIKILSPSLNWSHFPHVTVGFFSSQQGHIANLTAPA